MWNKELEFKWVSSSEIIQKNVVENFVMDLFSLFLLTHENKEIKSPTKIYDFTVFMFTLHITNLKVYTVNAVSFCKLY